MTYDLSKLTDFEIGKLVGLLEGEGYFGNSTSGGKIPVVVVNMTDKDVICWLAEIFDCNIYSRKTNKYNKGSTAIWKDTYSVKISGKKAAEVMRLVLPYMGERRSARIKEVLSIWQANPKKRQFKEEEIINIRFRHSNGESMLSLAEDYECSPGTIHHIVNFNSYKEVGV